MKKYILLICALVAILALTACAGNEEPTTPTPTPPPIADTGAAVTTPDPTTPDATPNAEISGDLFIWVFEEALGEPLARAFEALHPNVRVDFEHVGMTDQRQMVTLDGPAGIGPDVFMQPHDGVALAINDGIVEPFPADLQARIAAQVIPTAVQTAMRDGRLYGAPFQTENIAFFYNREFVSTPPTTFEEVLDFAREWNDPAQNRFAMRWQVNDAFHNYPFLTAFGFSVFGPNMDDYRIMPFDGDAVRRGLEFHNQFRQYFDFATEDVTWDASVAAFQRGEVPFTISGPWAVADARANGIDFGVTRLPTMGGNQPRVFSGATIAHVSSFSENKDAAFAFVEFLATEAGASILYETLGTLTALIDISAIPGLVDDPYLRGFQAQAYYSNPMPTIPEVDLMWGPMATLFTHTWNGSLSVADTQALAMQEYIDSLALIGLSMQD